MDTRIRKSRTPTKRDRRKEATRRSVIAAAHDVFLKRGFEAATIKHIAETAGVSVGTVMNAAPNKRSLLLAVLAEEIARGRELRETLERHLTGPAIDRIVSLLRLGYEEMMKSPEIWSATISQTWRWTPEEQASNTRILFAAWAPIDRVLAAAQEAGEIDPGLDRRELVLLILDIYIRGFRRALFEGAELDAVCELLRWRLTLILRGAAPR